MQRVMERPYKMACVYKGINQNMNCYYCTELYELTLMEKSASDSLFTCKKEIMLWGTFTF